MSLKPCKECGNNISRKAAACPHCGAANKASSGSVGCLIILAAVGLFIGVPAIMGGGPSSIATTKPEKTLGAKLNWDRSYIYIKNETCTNRTVTRCTVYINGLPGWDSYKAECDFPTIGNTTQTHLRRFQKKDGAIFDNDRTAVTEAWIGGSGYDYEKWTK